LKILQINIQTMEFTSKYLNSLKTLHSLKTLPHPNTLLGFRFYQRFVSFLLWFLYLKSFYLH